MRSHTQRLMVCAASFAALCMGLAGCGSNTASTGGDSGEVVNLTYMHRLPDSEGMTLVKDIVAKWNNFLLPLMMVSSDTLKPVTLGLYGMVSLATFNDRGSLMMGALLGVLPVIVLFLGLQRYWQAGLAAGAVKG